MHEIMKTSILERLIRLVMAVPAEPNEPIHNAIILSFKRKDAA